MKRLSAFLIPMVILLFSCNNDAASDEAKATDTVATRPVDTVAAKPAFSPFKVVVIQHKVKNFEKSRAGYFNNDSIRNVYGITHYLLGRDLKDSNTVFVMDKIEDVEKAKTYAKQPKVEEAMKKAGVSRAPGYTYAEIVRSADTRIDSGVHVSVTHHVKDFNVWLKAFDAEAAARPANGLIDQAIARNLYDSNTISIIFAVSDLAKAKARISSPELKKIMTDAGVDGTPAVRWFREVK